MLAYISVNSAGLPTFAVPTVVANADTYNSVIAGKTLTVSDPARGVIANDLNVSNVRISVNPTNGTVNLNADGTFTYVPNSSWTVALHLTSSSIKRTAAVPRRR